MPRPRGRSRGVKEWSGITFPLVTLSTTQAVLAVFPSTFPDTVLRVRGFIHITGVPDAALESDQVGLGLIVASDPAVAAGGAAVQGPIADADGKWLWHQYVPLMSMAATSASGTEIGLQARIEVDSKAMRKVGSNESLILVGELSTGGLVTVRAHGGFRVLKLQG